MAAAVLALGACGDEADSTSPSAPAGQWAFISGAVDGAPITAPDGAVITLDVAATSVAGSAGCNRFGAKLAADRSGAWAVTDVFATEMYCDDMLAAFEATFLAVLQRADGWAIDAEVLALGGADVGLRFGRAAAVAEAALVGSDWELDAVVRNGGEVAYHSSRPGRLMLRADGILSGFDTCQAYLGEWNEAVGATPTQEPAGDDGSLMTVRVVSFGVADPDAACPDASAEVAGVMRAVLADDFTALVRGRTLRITGESGTGLAFHTTSTTPDGS